MLLFEALSEEGEDDCCSCCCKIFPFSMEELLNVFASEVEHVDDDEEEDEDEDDEDEGPFAG